MRPALLIAAGALIVAGSVWSCDKSAPPSTPTGSTGGAGAAGQTGTPGSGGASGGSPAGTGGTAAGSGGATATGGSGGPGGRGAAGQSGRGGGTGGAAGAGGLSGASGAGGGSARGGAGGARPTVTAASGTTLVKVNPAVRHQLFEGWGTSLCWWANHVGGWGETGRNAVVDAVVDPVNGLGYNVFRYNIGGGENPAHDHMGQYREMPGFEPSSGTWDWTADANQRAVLQRIVQSGTGIILEAF